ncbi:hypothetical protein GLX30_30230 [Streptomyces sp. Tu 2975]|uniref:hypothetical protein n=1 Tax=Streptomyces sp. Tu 2975 TaxID=2676871 RepID=UPI00135AC0B6|nr:hypothetical protein [Streptomyces sp. Tu 2975]QIP87594.1 hypothetical protein GLX30_30230 [Streptomyces sp. Tu 2975]
MTAVDFLFAAGYLALVGLFARAVCRRLPGGRAHRQAERRAQVARELAAYRLWRLNPPRIDTTPGDPYSDLRLEAELIAAASRKEQVS